ncbi:MAG: lysylphosphatidylglycerol synthase transmembrane domain-containing protein [Pseudomonadota bacterium]|nr:lysylphosphatidylglycerol synthase transmembrane domain-containing protein [Pseudomonadota bacterium]
MRAKTRRWLLFGLKLSVSLALVAYVANKTGLDSREGWSLLGETLANIDWRFFWLSILVGILLNATSSFRWQILLRSKGLKVSFWRLLGFYYIGRFFNMFLPTSVGGDAARVWDLGKHTGDNYEALASVFMERFIGMAVLATVSAVALARQETRLPIITNSLLFVIGVVAILLWLVLDKRVFNFARRMLSPLHPLVGRLFDKLERVHDAIYSYRHQRKTLLLVITISTFFYLLAVINVWFSARAFSSEIQFSDMLLAVPAIMLIMNLPVSIGGLGLMEAGYTTIFVLFGYSPAIALSTALLVRFKTIVNAFIGAVIHISRLRTHPDQEFTIEKS